MQDAQPARFQVGEAAERVAQLRRPRVDAHGERVDGEVAAGEVGGQVALAHARQRARVVVRLGARAREVEHQPVGQREGGGAEGAVDRQLAAEPALQGLRERRRPQPALHHHVEVEVADAQQAVAHGAAHQVEAGGDLAPVRFDRREGGRLEQLAGAVRERGPDPFGAVARRGDGVAGADQVGAGDDADQRVAVEDRHAADVVREHERLELREGGVGGRGARRSGHEARHRGVPQVVAQGVVEVAAADDADQATAGVDHRHAVVRVPRERLPRLGDAGVVAHGDHGRAHHVAGAHRRGDAGGQLGEQPRERLVGGVRGAGEGGAGVAAAAQGALQRGAHVDERPRAREHERLARHARDHDRGVGGGGVEQVARDRARPLLVRRAREPADGDAAAAHDAHVRLGQQPVARLVQRGRGAAGAEASHQVEVGALARAARRRRGGRPAGRRRR